MIGIILLSIAALVGYALLADLVAAPPTLCPDVLDEIERVRARLTII